MSNEILSQEEIDALLGAMDKGEVNLASDEVAATETEAKERKHRVEDALSAAQVAVEEGVVPMVGILNRP